MKKIILNIITILLGAAALRAASPAEDPNLVIENRHVKYDLVAGADGKLSSVKMRDEMRFRAKRKDETAVAFTHYHDKLKVDKASAPGAKVEYVQNFSDGAFYDDLRTCLMAFKVKTGKEAKAVFETTLTDPAQFCEIWAERYYPVEEYTIEINVPQPLAGKMRFEPRNLPSGVHLASSDGAKGGKRYELKLTDVKKSGKEPLGTPSTMNAPRILVSGYFDGVDDLYRYMKGFVDEENVTDDAIRQLSASITSACANEIEKIDTIASWVRQNIRYVGIEHGEYAHKPDAASSVLEKRYGDCKGSANLIKAMLKSSGIDGRLCWIGTYPEIDYPWEESPTLGAGNHMIAAAILPDTIVYIDGTASYMPKGHIPYSIQGQRAMVENGDTPIMASVPRLPAGGSADNLAATYTISDGMLTGRADRRLTGDLCAVYENAVNSVPSDRRELMLVKTLSTGRKSVNVSNVAYHRLTPSHPILQIDYDIADEAAITRSSKADYVTIDLLSDVVPAPIDTVGRQRGVFISMPYDFIANVTLKIPQGYTRTEVPEDYKIDNKWYEGEIKYLLTDTDVEVECRISPREITARRDELDTWNLVVKEIRKASTRRIKLIK